jgi:hypothetical protein
MSNNLSDFFSMSFEERKVSLEKVYLSYTPDEQIGFKQWAIDGLQREIDFINQDTRFTDINLLNIKLFHIERLNNEIAEIRKRARIA